MSSQRGYRARELNLTGTASDREYRGAQGSGCFYAPGISIRETRSIGKSAKKIESKACSLLSLSSWEKKRERRTFKCKTATRPCSSLERCSTTNFLYDPLTGYGYSSRSCSLRVSNRRESRYSIYKFQRWRSKRLY